MSNIDPMLMRQIIMDHYDYPRNKELTDNKGYMSRHMASDSCIDDITVQTKISDGKIDDIRFDGVACTISTASTSIMSELLKGKTTEEAKEIMDNYFKMIDQKEYDEDVLDEAIAFQNVGKQANRINCATIGWKAMREMIKESEDEKDEQWFGVEHCKAPELLRDALLDGYRDFLEQQLTHNRRSLTETEILDIQNRCEQLYDLCGE